MACTKAHRRVTSDMEVMVEDHYDKCRASVHAFDTETHSDSWRRRMDVVEGRKCAGLEDWALKDERLGFSSEREGARGFGLKLASHSAKAKWHESRCSKCYETRRC